MNSRNDVLLAPSILAGNHAALGESLAHVHAAGLKWVHLDIMDGHFVPNLSFGPQTVRDLRTQSNLFFDVHLMLDNPQHYIDAFADAGADQITIHVEPDFDQAGTLAAIQERGCKRGIVLNPDTPASAAEPYLEQVDIVLLMTVQPGFGGQSFRTEVVDKIRQVSERRAQLGLHFRLEVDGGIDLESAPACIRQGADTLVAGTAFFRADDPAQFAAAITNPDRD